MRRGLFALVLGMAGPLVQATDDPAVSARKPTTIESVQVEFKSLHPPQHLPEAATKLSLPGLTSLDTSEAVPIQSPLQRAKELQEKNHSTRSKNWLVDAMMKPDKTSTLGNKADADDTEKDEALDPFERLIAENKQGVSSEAQTAAKLESDREELKSKVVNPLSGYMSGWISARDQDLLLRDVAAPDAALTISRFSDSLPPSGPILSNGVFSPPSDAPQGGVQNPFSVPANPYLALPAISPDERSLIPVSANSAPDPIPPQPPVQVTAPPPQAPPARDNMPPGLAKPEEDARYFPQLKRF
ncbi:MAG: hypothetical protein K9M98_09805 [Cephaloticoccus sp.]|nr:hypothetical protein [Cephaloticoccus sp.]MCF7760787.1 hypothetical protein [Cephaloticoccus sp.]